MKRFLFIAFVLLAALSASAQNGTLDPTNPPEPNAKYRLTVKAQPAEAATTSGSGEYAQGTKVTVRATAKTNYVFKHWLQNGTQLSQTSTSFQFTMPAEFVEFVAVFEYQEPDYNPTNPSEPQSVTPEYPLYLMADPVGAGTFNRTSGAKVKEGTTVSITATPATGYQFVGWYDAANTQLSTSRTLSYLMPSNTVTLTARFTYTPNNPNEPTGSQTGVDNSDVRRGDVNGDGEVNVTDLIPLVSMILGQFDSNAAADVNGDGEVNVTDLIPLVNMILNGSRSQPR